MIFFLPFLSFFLFMCRYIYIYFCSNFWPSNIYIYQPKEKKLTHSKCVSYKLFVIVLAGTTLSSLPPGNSISIFIYNIIYILYVYLMCISCVFIIILTCNYPFLFLSFSLSFSLFFYPILSYSLLLSLSRFLLFIYHHKHTML